MNVVDRIYRAQVRNPALPPRVQLVMKAVAVFVRKVGRDAVPVRAGTLSYWTLVALVPVLILVALVVRGLGLDAWLSLSSFFGRALAAILPEWDAVGLPAEINASSIGVVGLAVTFGASARIYLAAEEAYNRIWNARVRKALTTRLSLFYATITLAPIVMASSASLAAQAEVATSTAGLHLFTPVLITAIAFVFAIRAMPDTEVRWKPALIGGLASAAAFEAMKEIFGTYILVFQKTGTAAVIYGSLAFVPIFLLFVYVMWTIVLMGVELAVVVQRWREFVRAEDRLLDGAERRGPDAFFALQCLLVVARRFSTGKGPTTEPQVTEALGSDADHVHSALEVLEEAQLLGETFGGYTMLGPLDQLTVADVIRRYRERHRPATNHNAPGTEFVEHAMIGPAFGRTVAELVGT